MTNVLTPVIVLFLALILSQLACAQQTNQTSPEIPAHFIGNRIFVRPVTLNGDTLNLYTDTGGGLFLGSKIVERLGLPTEKVIANGDTTIIASLPEFNPSASVPPVPALPNMPIPSAMQGHLPVFPSEQTPDFFGDGMLGQVWFAKRAWTFDYPNQELLLRTSGELPSHDAAHQVPIYFRTDSNGQHTGHWPRIQAIVDGDTLDLLHDTGATLALSDSAHAALNDGEPQVRGTSYIIASIFDRWTEQHSAWPVIEDAESWSGEPIIEVPQVTIAGHTVGPVWFTRRADENFTEFMSQYMDRPIVGAVGGSLFKYFRMTVDYPNEVAYFDLQE